MADIGAVDLLGYRGMGQLFNIGMTVPAGDIMMHGFAVDMFIDIIIMSFSVFVNPAEKTVFVAHETVLFVRRLCRRTVKPENGYGRNEQKTFYDYICCSQTFSLLINLSALHFMASNTYVP